MENTKLNFQAFKATSKDELNTLELTHRTKQEDYEICPFAINTKYTEIAEKIIKDKNAPYNAPLFLIISEHNVIIGAKVLAKRALDYYNESKNNSDLDILSISVEINDETLKLKTLLRIYDEQKMPNINAFFESLGESIKKVEKEEKIVTGKILIPEEIKKLKPSPEDINKHNELYKAQQDKINGIPLDTPFLNKLDNYVSKKIRNPEEYSDLIYDLKSIDSTLNIKSSPQIFTEVFNEAMNYVSGTEYYTYMNSLTENEAAQKSMLEIIKGFITNKYIDTNYLAKEDLGKLMQKIEKAIYKLYIIQDLINDPDITDIHVTAHDEIRVRCKGKTYLSNVSFVNDADYMRFLNMICVRKGILRNMPTQTFTYSFDENYILRQTVTSEYVTSSGFPELHIRKIARHKMMADDLIKAGMMDEKIRDYLLDAGRTSRGVVFAGPPGSGKTVMLNWFFEDAYERSADILIIQENDELFPYRKGVKCQHVVNYTSGDELPVSLEELGRLALVAGANVFIIGEAKGPEICSAITLSNSGCRTALTIHSNSSTETIDKMADLAMRGYAQDFVQAKRMIKSFQTIVYLQDFKVQEISEIIGYDEEKKDMIYRRVYKRESA